MASFRAAENALLETRWIKADTGERRELPREALRKYNASTRKVIAAIDRLIEVLVEPEFEARMTRFIKLLEAHGQHIPMTDLSSDGWRLLRRVYVVEGAGRPG